MRRRTVPALGALLLALSLIASPAPIASAQPPGPVATPDETTATCAQNNGTPNGSGIIAQDHGEGYEEFLSYGAADFKLDSTCKVTSVRIEGFAPDGGTATEARIWIYKNNGAIDLPTPPGSEECAAVKAGPGPDFRVPLSHCKLKKGRYWLAVQVQQDYATQGVWRWVTTDEPRQLNDAWRNPPDGFGTSCRKWATVDDCVGFDWEYLFSISGR